MDLYQITFAVLVTTSCWLAWAHHLRQSTSPPSPAVATSAETVVGSHGDPKRFKYIFLMVYLLVMGSDWLQGAYVYTLYKDEKNLAETVVAGLFTCGFLSAAISALFVGGLADKYGRRLACLVFCVTYAIGCLTKISNDITILFIGRLLGGLSTTLMFCSFESWMVTEYFAQGLNKSSLSLDSMFGIMTTLNSIVAVMSGVIGEGLVAMTGTKVSPFMAAILCLSLAFVLMLKYWGENYGEDPGTKNITAPEKSAFKLILEDKRILVLGFLSCCFEGSMYIFVFYWSAAMKSAHAFSQNLTNEEEAAGIPFGVIFATFMAAMMLGSLAFTYASSSRLVSISKFVSPAMLLTIASAGAAFSLLAATIAKDEAITFWAFCLFEACIGIYFPAIGAQRAIVVDDSVRAKVYGILRIPLNIFVVVALTTTVEGDSHRDKVFMLCGALLILSSFAAMRYLGDEKYAEIDTADDGKDIV